MKKSLMMALVMLLICTCCMYFAFAQQEESSKDGKESGMAAPGDEHKLLEQFDGEWIAKAKFMMEPGKPFVESTGSETCKISLGGFWLTIDYSSQFMGVPYQGHGMMGYDQHKKKFISVWADSMKSQLSVAEGDYDEASKTFTLSSKNYCPMERKEITVIQTYSFKNKDRFLMTFSTQGSEGEMMEVGSIDYTRKK